MKTGKHPFLKPAKTAFSFKGKNKAGSNYSYTLEPTTTYTTSITTGTITCYKPE